MDKRCALITGASSGIGLELAKLLAADGYDLIVAADDPAIATSAEELRGGGVEVEAVQVDLRKPKEVERLYRSVTAGGRRIDVAALNAGIGGEGPFVDRDLDEDLAIVDLNVRSTVHLAKLVLRDMAERGEGKVLFTSSIVAGMPGWNQTMYNASKSFVQSFVEALHDEMRGTGVTVTSLMPGPTRTEFFRRAGMTDTVLGRMPKDEPARVAKQGYDALMRGDRKVVAASLFSKAMGISNAFLPDSVKSAANRLIVTRTGSN
ncbi:SDR family NAD(P)-dependent oxidoreductase [Mycobacterium deserti]|uniref:SDR family NAD(P)-dependent oxidoreductase n=1 Tax=Mycobacterium deserti TaxID=2978347 RepID=A0ABT2M4Y2_9MYCO|nr:SDR family NAD(P)-dependent oxidoreductase [Mycobacterium deserti]MCT7657307.1 SDR family NAD(P)-dependent oxidoreductase [Mycobacterium deserti]